MDHRKEDAILHRQFELDEDGTVDLYVWRPFAETDVRWACTFLIEGLGAKKPKNAYGVDAAQALCLCLIMASTDLYTSEAYKEGRLAWLGSRDLCLPFIRGTVGDGAEFGQAQMLFYAQSPTVVQIPDHPIPFIALSGRRLSGLTRRIDEIANDLKDARLTRILEGLKSDLNLYERVCREQSIHIDYDPD